MIVVVPTGLDKIFWFTWSIQIPVMDDGPKFAASNATSSAAAAINKEYIGIKNAHRDKRKRTLEKTDADRIPLLGKMGKQYYTRGLRNNYI